jgi:hypothetical protein
MKFYIKHNFPRICVFIAFIILLFSAELFSFNRNQDDEKIENVTASFTGREVLIKYDLLGEPGREYEISVILKRKSNNTFSYKPKILQGDYGKGKFAGKGRQILWDFSKEFENGLLGNDYYFEVNIENSKTEYSKILWIGAGVAVLGGGVAYLIFKKDKTSSTVDFPPPPIRP